MMICTLPLSSAGATLATAGGKGANLQRLIAGNFPVPPGFVLTTAAYRAFVDANDLATLICEESASVNAGDPTSFAVASEAIRVAFGGGRIPPEVVAEIDAAYRNLGSPAVAVCSSATAEDLSEASFAGQQDTFLNVQGEVALQAAVRDCWSSLWTARAIAYRTRQAIAPDAVSLAVVVQEMVAAECAGVLFTINPLNGNADEIVINATWGLGEALVAGQVNPDTVVVNKASGRVKRVDVGDKAVMTVPVAAGTAAQPVTGDRRQQQALSVAQAARLAQMGRKIEAHFGIPQDVEWAIADGEVAILQARPVTALAAPAAGPTPPGDDAWPPYTAAPQPFDRWTQADVGERWPEPVTPFTWSTARPLVDDNMIRSFAGTDPALMAAINWSRRAYGRVYFNEGALIHVFTTTYGMPAWMVSASLANPEYIAPEENRWHLGPLLRRGPLIVKMTRDWERNVRRFDEDFARIDAWVDTFMARNLADTSDAALWQQSETTWHGRMVHYMEAHANATSISLTAFSTVESLLGRWLGRNELVYDLIGGVSDVIAAEIVPTLWQITREFEAAGLASVLLQQEPAAALQTLRQMPAAAPRDDGNGGARAKSPATPLFSRDAASLATFYAPA